jgi:hypothetical protein
MAAADAPVKARMILHLLGYSDDPREIWEIAAAAAYVRQWAQLAGIVDFGATIAGSLRRESVGFLAACGVFGRRRAGQETSANAEDLEVRALNQARCVNFLAQLLACLARFPTTAWTAAAPSRKTKYET